MAEEPMPASQAKASFGIFTLRAAAKAGAGAEAAAPLLADLEEATFFFAASTSSSLPKAFSRMALTPKETAKAMTMERMIPT